MELAAYLESGITQTELAKMIGVQPVLIHQWARHKRPVPAERCIEIERATNGAVTCEELRDDIDWSVLRIPRPKAHAA